MKIPIRWLYFLSTVYIVLPIIIFAFGWMKLPFALIILAGFGFVLYFLVRNKNTDSNIVFSRKEFIRIGILLFVWTLLSGAGHRGYFDGDAYKHNAILNDLISLGWPVVYRLHGSKDIVYLCYYIAYYLPAAVIGKLWGWKAGNIFLFGWTLGGVLLAISWFVSLFKKANRTLYAFLFILFGGLDVVGRFIMRNKVVNGEDWEWWARNWQYSGHTTLLSYVPQHALVGWILTGIVVSSLFSKKQFPFLLVLFVCSLLWSPFVFLGLVPFVGIYIWEYKRQIHPTEWFLSALFLSFQLIYFASNLTFFVKETGASAWLWQFEKITESWVLLRLLLFYLFEFCLFAIFAQSFYTKIRESKRKLLFTVSVIILFLLPWYKLGLLNDFVMRVSIPSLWIVSYFWISTVVEEKISKKTRTLFVIIFLLAAVYPARVITNGIIHFSWGPPKASLTTYQDPMFRRQYLGKKGLFFSSFAQPIQKRSKMGIMQYK